jgi:L-alanine-DL-glutamate epimerase-like enolase superfamily enzyme
LDATAAAREPAAPDSLPQLTIERIELIPVVVPLDREYRGSFYGMSNRATVITRVHTAEGVVGEAYAGDEDSTLGQIVRVVEREIAPRLIGVDAFGYERCWELGYPATFDQLRDRRIGLVALAGVDLAIWDALGKAAGRPLWQLWGGYRDRIPVNIIGGYYGRDLAEIRDEVAEWREMGFRGCKFKIGGRSPVEDAARVQAAREAAGEDFVLTIDANQGYTLAQALELCERVRDLNIRWFEEPCIWSNDRRDMREVRARGGIPVCAGQSEYSPGACRDLMEAGAIDVCNFDASWSGGYTNWKRMAALSQLYSVDLAHHEEPQVAMHLLASQPNGTYGEVFHPDRDPIWWKLIANRGEIVDGELVLPREPGFGWTLDQDIIDAHKVELD